MSETDARTDLVDTNALRKVGVVLEGHHSWHDEAEAAGLLHAAAGEVDSLRAQLAAVNVNAGLRLEALRAAIKNAPHGDHCALYRLETNCDCWKADAL